MTLSVLQTFVPNEGDGWSWVLERLARGAGPGMGDTEALDEATSWLRRLGRRTAEMHAAFETDADDPAFRPEPVSTDDIRSWAAAAQETSHRALEGLTHGTVLEPQALGLAEALLARRDEVVDRLQAMLGEVQAFAKTRHHGDHLGQVLATDGDAAIIDFEGEPLRPLAERRAKRLGSCGMSPGCSCSFAHAAAAASRALPREKIFPSRERDAVENRLAAWEAEASQLSSTPDFETARGNKSCPENRADADRVVRFFMLEKVLYEIAYELANRPEWVAIPLCGVLALLDKETAPAPTLKHQMPFGAELQADGRVRFRLSSTPHREVQIELDGETAAMQPAGEGWHELVTDRARAGTRYRFVLPDGLRVPDPASRYQPEDVHGPSEVVDPGAYVWRDVGNLERPPLGAGGRQPKLRIGTFTPEGTVRAAIGKLDHLVELGVTAIEIMPIGDFPGRRNWGYDGVLLYAPDYFLWPARGPEGAGRSRPRQWANGFPRRRLQPLRTGRRLYPPGCAADTSTDRHKTPWGAAINFDGPDTGPVREFIIHNALYWIEEFHFPRSLRPAPVVHAISMSQPEDILLVSPPSEWRAAAPDRYIHLILENEENRAERGFVRRTGRPRRYTAQWNDDVHHVLHVAASGETKGYYVDYKSHELGRALAEGFAFQGELMPYRGRPRGAPSAELPLIRSVAFIQNHDQVGNRVFGDRADRFPHRPKQYERLRRSICCCRRSRCCSWARSGAQGSRFPSSAISERSWPMRCARAGARSWRVSRNSRIRLCASASPIRWRGDLAAAKLDWEDIERATDSGWLNWYRRVLAIRRAEIVPRLPAIQVGGRYQVRGDGGDPRASR